MEKIKNRSKIIIKSVTMFFFIRKKLNISKKTPTFVRENFLMKFVLVI